VRNAGNVEHLVIEASKAQKLLNNVGASITQKLLSKLWLKLSYFGCGQLLPAELLFEELNIRYFLTSGVMFRVSDMELKQLKT
jgi:hypothetical protein